MGGAQLALISLPESEGIVGWKLELGEVGPNTGGEQNACGEPNAGGEPKAGGREADVQEDSLGGGLELNDDRRPSMSITSASVDLLSDFSLRILTVFSSDCSDNFSSCIVGGTVATLVQAVSA